MNITEAQKDLANLVAKVYSEGITVDLEQDNKVVARLVPARPHSPLAVDELNAFLRGLPSLGDDADQFSKDVDDIRAAFRQ